MPSGEPILQPWTVIERGGVKLGLFALAGSRLREARQADQPPRRLALRRRRACSRRRSSSASARSRSVDAVILIGHRAYEEDVKLAQTVPGIDVILGTHSHRKEDLKQIPGTSTWIHLAVPVPQVRQPRGADVRGRQASSASPAAWSGWARIAPRRPTSPSGSPAMQRDLEADPHVRRALREARAGRRRDLRRQHQHRRVRARRLGPGHRPRSRRRPARPLDRQQLPRRHPARRRHRRGLPDRRALQEPRARPRDDRRPGPAAPRRQRRPQGHRQPSPR